MKLNQIMKIDKLSWYIKLCRSIAITKSIGFDSIFFRMNMLFLFAFLFAGTTSTTVWVMCFIIVLGLFDTAIKLSDIEHI